jgi:hypothetical protein
MKSPHEQVITRVGSACIALGLLCAVFMLRLLYMYPPENGGISWGPLDILLIVGGYSILTNRSAKDVQAVVPLLGLLTAGCVINGVTFTYAPHLADGSTTIGPIQLSLGFILGSILLNAKMSGILDEKEPETEAESEEEEEEEKPLPVWMKVSIGVYVAAILFGFVLQA